MTVAVAAALILASIALLGSGSEEEDLVTGKISEKILQPEDMGAGWTAYKAFSNATGPMPSGAYEDGSITLKSHNATGQPAFIIEITLVFFNSSESAESFYQGYIGNPPMGLLNPQSVQVGDNATIYDAVSYLVGHDGKILVLKERNVVCYISYGATQPGQVTEVMAIEAANKQIDKL
ncbi:hypothetical protein [Methanomassiliicoccus luminyensis]|uniref:hypothetical protein n=1 Tax=Methanomassiliicoccus luminyensis TaxID=1080712 RepID=UPI000363DB94|nr:hypothetical protein [Methanomassiliicoccus luminyensis]